MKKAIASYFLVLALFLFPSSKVFAVGIGFYGTVGAGSADWDSDDLWSYTYSKFSTDTEHKGLGLALDTRLAGEGLFNYHLDIGYEKFTAKDFIVVPGILSSLSPVTTDVNMRGVVMSHAFGFGANIAPHVRLWFGPEIRLQWAKGEPSATPSVDVKMFGVGIGPALGLNLNFHRGASLVIKTGYQFISSRADVDGIINTLDTVVNQSYDIDEKLFYVNLEFLFRSLGDR